MVRKTGKPEPKKRKKSTAVIHRPKSTSSVPPYKKPPVREAIIDIGIQYLSSDYLPRLASIHEAVRDLYPVRRTRHIAPPISQPESSTADPIGYVLQTQDRKEMVQIRLDGFTFNRLKPDPNEGWVQWSYVRNRAREMWNKYVDTVGVVPITRLSVRYLNQVVIPAKDKEEPIDLSDYLNGVPKPPTDLPYQAYDHFFSRLQILVPDLDAKALITLLPADVEMEHAGVVILDIDVYRNGTLRLQGEELWTTLDRFRDVKNTIFQGILTKKAQRLFL